jgi:hypothetical protein
LVIHDRDLLDIGHIVSEELNLGFKLCFVITQKKFWLQKFKTENNIVSRHITKYLSVKQKQDAGIIAQSIFDKKWHLFLKLNRL